MTVKVKFKGDKIKVQAGEGYCPNVKDLLILTDNGNGYFRYATPPSQFPLALWGLYEVKKRTVWKKKKK
jgi:hypothetical protein